jgi:hypothetical protein
VLGAGPACLASYILDEPHEEVSMSDRAGQFVTQWVETNIHARSQDLQGDNTAARALAPQLLEDAEAQGIPRMEVELFTGDVVSYLADKLDPPAHA